MVCYSLRCRHNLSISSYYLELVHNVHFHRPSIISIETSLNVCTRDFFSFCPRTFLCCPRAKLQEGFPHKDYLPSAPPSRHSACPPSDGAQRAGSALCRWQGGAPQEPATEYPTRQRGQNVQRTEYKVAECRIKINAVKES